MTYCFQSDPKAKFPADRFEDGIEAARARGVIPVRCLMSGLDHTVDVERIAAREGIVVRTDAWVAQGGMFFFDDE